MPKKTVKLIAHRLLTGSFGTVPAGEPFDADPEEAQQLVERDLAHHANAPKVEYESKIIAPEAPEVSASESFRNRDVRNKKSKGVASGSNKKLSGSNAPKPRTADSKRRSGRSGSGPKRPKH